MQQSNILILGDILAILLITLIGFATHGELDISFISTYERIILSTRDCVVSLAPWLGLFQLKSLSKPHATLATCFSYAVCRAAGGSPARINSQCADHSDLCSCPWCDLCVWNGTLASDLFSLEPQR